MNLGGKLLDFKYEGAKSKKPKRLREQNFYTKIIYKFINLYIFESFLGKDKKIKINK